MKRVNSKSRNFGKAIGAILLALVFAVGGAVAGWYAHAQNWFGLCPPEDPTDEGGTSAGGGLLVEPEEENGIHIAAAKLTEEIAEAEGISLSASDVPNLDQIYILTATVTPTSATASVKWSMAFSNPSAEWATGKSPEDYVALRPLSGQTDATSAKAIAECKEAFGEQIKITCTAGEGEDAYGTCTADYAQRIVGMNVWFDIVSQEAGGAAIAQVDLTAGEDIYIPNSSEGTENPSQGSTNSQVCELKAEPVLSDVYTVAETNAQCQVSFLTTPAAEGDTHRYFYNADAIDEITESVTVGSALTVEELLSTNEVAAVSEEMFVAIRRQGSNASKEIRDAFNPRSSLQFSSSSVTGKWNGKLGAYYTFDQIMMDDLGASAQYYSFGVDNMNKNIISSVKEMDVELLENYYSFIIQNGGHNPEYEPREETLPGFGPNDPSREEVLAALNSLDEDVVLWRVAANVTGTYGSYTRGDSFIMYCTGEPEDAIEIPISNEDPGEIVF